MKLPVKEIDKICCNCKHYTHINDWGDGYCDIFHKIVQADETSEKFEIKIGGHDEK